MKPEKLAAAARRIQRAAGGPLDAAIVLGSGLGDGMRERIAGAQIPYKRLHAPPTTVPGHPGVAHVGTCSGKRVVAFAGRTHLYERGPAAVTYLVSLAAACGAKLIVLTNAAGGLNPQYVPGDAMLIADHINLTGVNPLERSFGPRFLSMTDAYAPHVRAVARALAGDTVLHEGVYAGVRGPQYETPAEAHALRRLGADAVGMSTVLETLAARTLGLDVLGISLITNALTDSSANVSHEDVLAAAQAGAGRIAALIAGVLEELP